MMTRIITVLVIVFGIAFSNVVVQTYAEPPPNKFSVGNLQLCNKPLFPVLPGNGWDNLRNEEMDMVVQHSFSCCATTDDNKFLVPDGVFTIPVKSSHLQTTSELIEHWDKYTSTLSGSINIEEKKFDISGKFSLEYSSVKSSQYNNKALTARTQARYNLYTSRLSRSATLSDAFKSRVRKIAFYVILNKQHLARYESQMLVRDYGTHVITNMDVGAAIVKIDNIKQESLENDSSKKLSITLAASASFFHMFSFGSDIQGSISDSEVESYRKQIVSSEIWSYGGHMFRPTNFSVNQWIDSIKDDMVAIDVSGDPLTFFINHETLPYMPLQIIAEVQTYVNEAITAYYKHNTYKGCTDPGSPNFNFQANMDDGTCKPPNTNFTFGGVYQACSSSGYTDLCADVAHKNPLTGDFTCRNGYSPVLLNSGTKFSPTTQRECSRCYLLFHCCNTKTLTAQASYSAYWCAADGPVGMNQGLLFGGTFTSRVANPLTQSNSCPKHFYGIKALQDLTICVSDDYELAGPISLPFAGFFTCQTGNPLVVSEERSQSSVLKNSFSFMSFIQESGFSSYPKQCPKDYSQHLAVVDSGCEINYCAKTGTFSTNTLIAVQRPPYMNVPIYEMVDLESSKVTVKGFGENWKAGGVNLSLINPAEMMSDVGDAFGTMEASAEATSKTANTAENLGLSGTSTGVIGAVVTLVSIGIIGAIMALVKRRREKLYTKIE